MDKFGMPELQRLIESREGPCITICMPTHVTRVDGQQDTVRLKNLAQRAEEALADGWLRGAEARVLAATLREVPAETAFWERRSHGLALFRDAVSLSKFRVSLRLDEFTLVNRRFHVKPLLPLLTSGYRFYLLALSQHKTRLLEATPGSIEPVEVAGLPGRIDEALNLDGADRGSQVHSGGPQGAGRQAGVFHGQGGERETHKDDLAQFFRLIDKALMPVLRGEQTPLLLAGVDYLLPIFRQVCRYPHVVKQELVGNFDHVNDRQMHDRAWSLLQPVFDRARHGAADKYRKLAGTGRTSDNVREIVPAATAGRVETLFVALRQYQWGLWDFGENAVEIHDRYQRGDDDLLDLASAKTLLNSGTVYSLETGQMPTAEPIAAVYRY